MGKRTPGHRASGRIRCAGGAQPEGKAGEGTGGGAEIRSCLRPQSAGNRPPGSGSCHEEGDGRKEAARNRYLLWMPCRGGGDRKGLYGKKRSIQGVRRGHGLPSVLVQLCFHRGESRSSFNEGRIFRKEFPFGKLPPQRKECSAGGRDGKAGRQYDPRAAAPGKQHPWGRGRRRIPAWADTGLCEN